MGNIATSSIDYANETFDIFFNQLKLDDLEPITTDSRQNQIDHMFSVFVEDFIVNDKTFSGFPENDKIKCVAALLLTYSSLSFELDNFCIKPPQYIQALLEGFEYQEEPREILEGLLASTTRYDGRNFFKWVHNNWVKCEESDIVCSDCCADFGSKTNIRPLGLTNYFAVKGSASIQEYMSLFNKAVSSFDTSKFRSDYLASLKHTVTKFNTKTKAIPCHDHVILLDKCIGRLYKPADQFLVRLPFNINQMKSPHVENYFLELNAEDNNLANFILSCGSRLNNTLTIVYGPPASGKSTIVNLVRALYGPYACSEAEHTAGIVNYDLVRTCFYDTDSPLKDPSLIKNHPCGHIVVVTDSYINPDILCSRLLRKLHFLDSIPVNNRKQNIILNLTTRKQLSHLLGWCLENYDTELFNS